MDAEQYIRSLELEAEELSYAECLNRLDERLEKDREGFDQLSTNTPLMYGLLRHMLIDAGNDIERYAGFLRAAKSLMEEAGKDPRVITAFGDSELKEFCESVRLLSTIVAEIRFKDGSVKENHAVKNPGAYTVLMWCCQPHQIIDLVSSALSTLLDTRAFDGLNSSKNAWLYDIRMTTEELTYLARAPLIVLRLNQAS